MAPKVRQNGFQKFVRTVSDCRKQTGPPDAGNNLRKSHFINCHVTKYSTIRGAFQQPWPGVSPTTILNEEKALGTRLKTIRINRLSRYLGLVQKLKAKPEKAYVFPCSLHSVDILPAIAKWRAGSDDFPMVDRKMDHSINIHHPPLPM